MYNIITIGDAVIDTHVQIDNAAVECGLDGQSCRLCLDFASKIPITDSFQCLGGNAANVACGTTKLGLKTAILTSVGNDSNGKLVKQELKKYGVDTGLLTFDAKTKTRYSVVLNFKGERTILSFHRKRSYCWPKKLSETGWIYFTGLSEGYEPLQEKLLTWIKKHANVRLAFNPGSFQLKNTIDKVKEVLPHTDILIVNLEEAERILGTTLEKEKTVNAIIHKLLSLGAREVAITDAGNGAYGGNSENIWKMASYPITVVAKTGAGDAFSSGYMSGRVLGHDIAHALQWGVANSCGVIGQTGAQKGLLDKSGIKRMIEKYTNINPTKIQ
ncbi:MAG: carbohydrate kinase family protein [Candidatus Magasanikbacteria bacterium]